jgi:pimeloyl-ACP methyl ester carboxylesterase
MQISEAYVRASGAELFLRRVGGGSSQASALVVVHGGPGISHDVLQALEPLASSSLEVVNYDQRGVGRSSGQVERTRVLEQSLDDLDAVVRSLGAPRVHLLGHFWGGLLAALYTAHNAAQVASLVLVDSMPASHLELAEALTRLHGRIGEYQARGLVPQDLPSLEQDWQSFVLDILPVYFNDPSHPGARTLAGTRYSVEAGRAARSGLAGYDVRAELGSMHTKTLHVMSPVPFGLAMGEAMASAMPKASARRILLSRAGHLPFIERPAPFFDAVLRFLGTADP